MAGQLMNELLFLSRKDLVFVYEGTMLYLKKPVGRIMNRYYLPLFEVTKYLGGRIAILQGNLYLHQNDTPPIPINKEDYQVIYHTGYREVYISLIDLCKIMRLKTRWNEKEKRITFYRSDDIVQSRAIEGNRIAFIRLEDVTAGGWYLGSEHLEKFRIVADYMYSLRMPFHIAWIPRYLNPPEGIDNDVSRNYSMSNAHFVFTIDYLLDCGGLIGLHGYTHQYGEEISGDGTEFSEDRNTDEATIRSRIEAAIEIADRLNYPYSFFESPHYASTAFQQSIYEFYFDIIYEGFVGIWGDKIVRSPRNHRTLYIPTPLGYVEGENGLEKLLERIHLLSDDALASLFYHLFMEFEFITLKNDFSYEYDQLSPLHQIVDAISMKKCRFSKITELNHDNNLVINQRRPI